MTFLEFKPSKEIKGYNVWNKKSKEIIGEIYYYHQWKKHIFQAIDEDIILTSDCLIDIAKFTEQLDKTSYVWRKVTCKNCLKQKNKKN